MSAVDVPGAELVITVVYDGPPEAGKTTSVRALARSFGREVYTPEERGGRTVYFDWLEHSGGRFEGAPIRCQIVSVPGQVRWTRRRGHFLDRADVVVFVGDTRAARWPETVARLRALRADLDRREGPPVGLVFQANKRDCDDAVPAAEVRARAADARIAVVDTVAHDGSGVREAFVFAVRLALDRVRAARDAGVGRAGVGAGDAVDLLELVRALDAEADAAPPAADPVTLADGPRCPAADVAPGLVWPPIEGRIVLREALAESPRARVTTSGDCVAGVGGAWRLHSRASAVWSELEAARAALITWARQHVAAGAALSRRRCLVVAETGDGGWRLWQVVPREPTLRELIESAPLGDDEADRLVHQLGERCAGAAIDLPLSIDTVGLAELNRPVFVGLMPELSA